MANTDDELTIYIDELTDEALVDINDNNMSVDITSSINDYSFATTGASGSYYISTGAGSNGTWSTTPYVFSTSNTSGLHVSTDAHFDGDIKWKGRSLEDMLTTIEKRLAILTPDPAKLEHFEALQKAYQHYKTLEALCEIPEKSDDGS